MLGLWDITVPASMTMNCLFYAHSKPNFEVLTLAQSVSQPQGDFTECQLDDLYNSTSRFKRFKFQLRRRYIGTIDLVCGCCLSDTRI